jgi:hypothetical protein
MPGTVTVTTNERRTQMDLGGMMDKAKDLASNVSDEQIDDAVDLVKEHVADEHDDKIDMAADKLKDLNN